MPRRDPYEHLADWEIEILNREAEGELAYYRERYSRPAVQRAPGDLGGADAGLFGPSVDEHAAFNRDYREAMA